MTRADTSDEFADLSELLDRSRADADAARADPLIIAASRRRRRRARILAASVILVLVAAIGTYVPMTLLAPVATATVSVSVPAVVPPVAAALSLPQFGASAVSVTGADDFEGLVGTNEILASSGSAGPLPMASISKLVTALVILDAKPLTGTDVGPTLTFDKADADLYDKYYVLDATVQPMKNGSTISERNALELMLVVSASNYAEAVSTWAFGSQADFLRAAKTWLAANGFADTSIVEPTGLDPRNVSSTADLLALGKLAMANPVIATIVGSPSVNVPTVGQVSSNNALLGYHGINGIKTGTLDESGFCLLFSAVLDVGTARPINVVGVVVGGANQRSLFAAVDVLLTSIEAGFHEVPVISKGQEIGTYTTQWKDDASVVAGGEASVFTWSDTPIASSVVTERVATGSDGSGVGTVTFVAGNATVDVPLVLDGTIDGPDGWWRLTHPFELFNSYNQGVK